jgi:phage tail sheath protein FI
MATANVGSTVSLSNGSELALTAADYETGYGEFTNPDVVDISLIVTGDAGGASSYTTVQQYAIDSIAAARKDCIAFISPPQSGIVGGATPEIAIATWINTTLNRASTYAVADCGWKYQFDKYNNVYRWIPLNGDIAGLCVRTDQTRDPWFSPAGVNRGAIKNVVKLAWNPTQAQRDYIYPIGVNPVVSFPGQGTILYGDKTLITQPSAFSRINVRRLFIVLEKAIATASKFALFELNDEFTRAQFIAIVEPFLRDVKGRRGIYDYRVVCDTTNNTPEVIDGNRFIGDIYIKPARSINYIQLNFVAVRTGVSFSEIVGAV